MSTKQVEIRDAIIEICMRLPERDRLLVLAAVWEHVARQGDPVYHIGAAAYLPRRALPSVRNNMTAARVAYAGALDEGFTAVRVTGEVEAEITTYRQALAALDEMVQCGGPPPDPECDRAYQELDFAEIERRLADLRRGRVKAH